MEEPPRYKRIVLKVSGEALRGDKASGICDKVLNEIALEIKEIHQLGIEIGLVIGGGNFFRGTRSHNLDIDRASADYMGMLATIMNGIALRDMLEKKGLVVRLVSALEIKGVAEPFVSKRVIRHLEKGRVVIFAAGTGNPFFTTDTAAALRAIEIKADILLKATNVEGVFAVDPNLVQDDNLVKFDYLSYNEVLSRELKIMDSTAFTLCREHRLPIKIFDITRRGNILKAVTDNNIGTSIN